MVVKGITRRPRHHKKAKDPKLQPLRFSFLPFDPSLHLFLKPHLIPKLKVRNDDVTTCRKPIISFHQ